MASQSDQDIDELCRILDIESIRDIDYDLSPARHVPIDPDIPFIPLKDSISLLKEIDHLHGKYIALRAGMALNLLKNKNMDSGKISKGWKQLPFEKIIRNKISGDWGCDLPDGTNDFVKCAVIRGTDFPLIIRGKLTSIPYRFISKASYEKKKPQIGDMLIEISGGGKYQNTGRALFFDSELVEQSDPPLMYTNFTKLFRFDSEVVEPKYAYYFWVYLYDLGRTARYEKQPTNIKNFKFNDFLKNESIIFPENIEEQKKIIRALDNINEEINHVLANISHLQGLRHSAMTELLKGESIILTKNK